MPGSVDYEAWSRTVETLAERPLMIVKALRYDVFCAFITGFGIGRDDGVLVAFIEWLADRQPAYKNYGMYSMVLDEAGICRLGETEQVGEFSAEDDAAARTALVALLSQFLAAPAPATVSEREGGGNLRHRRLGG